MLDVANYVNYLVYLAIFTAIFALFSIGLNLQWGFTGLINFGHVAFLAIGAYVTVLLSSQGVPLLIAVVIGSAVSALLGLLIGLSTLRLREDYLGIVTIGVSELVRLVALNEEWLTKGSFGVQGYPLPMETFRPNLFSKIVMIGLLTVVAGIVLWRLWEWARRRWQQVQTKGKNILLLILAIAAALFVVVVYSAGAIALYNYTASAGLMLVTVVSLALVFFMVERLVRSPWGRVLKAIREDEQVPKALGKNVFWYKLQAFMLGGAIASIAGSFYAWQIRNVYPSNFEPLMTFNAWTIVVLGGAGNNVGTLLGAIIFWGYDTITRFALPAIIHLDESRLGAFRVMVIGLILMVLMVWRPQGILGKKEELTLGR